MAQSEEAQSDVQSSINRSDSKTDINPGAANNPHPYDEELIKELEEYERNNRHENNRADEGESTERREGQDGEQGNE